MNIHLEVINTEKRCELIVTIPVRWLNQFDRIWRIGIAHEYLSPEWGHIKNNDDNTRFRAVRVSNSNQLSQEFAQVKHDIAICKFFLQQRTDFQIYPIHFFHHTEEISLDE